MTVYILDYNILRDKLSLMSFLKKEVKEGDVLIIPGFVHDLILIKEKEGGLEARVSKNFKFLEEYCRKNKISLKIIRISEKLEPTQYLLALAKSYNGIIVTLDSYIAGKASIEGLKCILVKKVAYNFEKLFDKDTLSIHIKEGSPILAKKGKPGNWKLEKITEKPLDKDTVEGLRDYFLELARIDENCILDLVEDHYYVIRYKDYRIVIIEPPKSSSIEIVIVKSVRKLTLDEYNLPKEVIERLDKKAEGILICGRPGSGKSTFAKALALYYLSKGKIVKVVENPATEKIADEITHIRRSNFKTVDELRNYLLLARPDYVIYDEVREDFDFKAYIDLRLAGIGMIGVTHASEPIDVIQRFITRIDIGMIPSIVDTIFFIEGGGVKKILELKLVVKVPTGLKTEEVTRPVVEVRDFLTKELEYEIYKYGQEVVIVNVKEQLRKQKTTEKNKVVVETGSTTKEEKKEKLEELFYLDKIEVYDNIDEVLQKVKEEYFFSKEDYKKVEEFISPYLEELRSYTDVFIGGSFAKKTMIKNSEKLSIIFFLLFDLFEPNIYEKAEEIVKNVFSNYEIKKEKNKDGSSEFHIILRNVKELGVKLFEFKILPARKISIHDILTKPSAFTKIEKAYVSNKYVLRKIEEDPKISDTITYLNLFTDGCYVNGAEAYICGFTSFAIELLSIYFKDFKKVVEFFNENQKYPVYIDVEGIYRGISHFLEEYTKRLEKNKGNLFIPKIIIISPITKDLETKKFEDHAASRFIMWCKLFMKYPSPHFFKRWRPTYEFIQKLAKIRGCELYSSTVKIVERINPVVRSLIERLKITKEKLEKSGKKVYDFGVIVEKNEVTLEKYAIPYLMVNAKNCEKLYIGYPWEKDFIEKLIKEIEKYKGKILYGPYVDYETAKVALDIRKEGVIDQEVKKLFNEIVLNITKSVEEIKKELKNATTSNSSSSQK